MNYRPQKSLWQSCRLEISKGLMAALGLMLFSSVWSGSAQAAPSFQQVGTTLVMSNANVKLIYNLNAGTTDFYWQNSRKIAGFYSGISFSTGYVKGINYSSWNYSVLNSSQAVVTATGSGLPTMKQYFTLDQTDSFLVRVDATNSGAKVSANWMGPVVVDSSTGWVNIGVTNDNRALFVPFDNDGFYRYDALPMSNSSSTSYELAAFYDNTSRNGLVVGSVTHNVWKSGVYFVGANNMITTMNVFGGAQSPWDVAPHGSISGSTISSPTMFVGFNADWRVALQNYANENTNFAPRLAWTNGVPFGWNSWGVIQENINYTDAIAASDFYYVSLMPDNFENNNTVYINLDSYWDNLTDSQLQSFAAHCHAHGEKAGIYWTPFVYWNTAAYASNSFVEGTTNTYLYSQILLRDQNGNPESVDGALVVDPTHPGTKDRINYYINEFTNWGFDYVKLDFLSHGAMEGTNHFDPNVTTGIEAYNEGMQYVLNAINGRMFISESIAPLFPYQYGHSRRIACDAETSLIANTEYTMNSVAYGWWLNTLYTFNDPDALVFGDGSDTNEAQSRLISGAVTGLMLGGDDITTASGQAGSTNFLTNLAIDNVARVGQTFTTVEGNSGSSAENIFVRQNSSTWCVAVFNYTAGATNETVDLNRAGLPSGTYIATNLWDGTTSLVTGTFNVSLNEKQSKLFQLATLSPANLPVISSAKISGGDLIFDGTGGLPNGTYYVLTATNLTTPPANWLLVQTNTFNALGAFSVTGTPVSSASQKFYRLVQPVY